jgi:hypothetical protein
VLKALKKLKYILSSLLFLLSTLSFAQKLTFDIFLFYNVIGQTVVERSVKNDSIVQYTLNSSSEAHVLLTTRITKLHYDITYKGGHYFSSYSKLNRNDEQHIITVQWQGNKYAINQDNTTLTLTDIIDCSTIKFFYAEPCNMKTVFSERLGENRPIKKTGDGVYQVDMKEGVTYLYKYKDGKLVELEMKSALLGSSYARPHR